MQLDQFYTIEHEPLNWTLTYLKLGEENPATGKPRVTSWSTYHMTLGQALLAYVDASVSAHDESIDTLLAKLDEIKQIIIEKCGSK